MALSVRRPSDWSIVLRTESGQVINFDKSNLRIKSQSNLPSSSSRFVETRCPQCHRPWPGMGPAQSSEHSAAHGNINVTGMPAFVHPEYFGLLASCMEEEEVFEEAPDEHDHLKHESFNQGYCERFFVEDKLLGRGGKAEVVRVRHVLEGVELGIFALKRVAVGDSQAWLLKTLREVQSIRFKHNNLVSYNHVWLERRQQKYGPTVPVLHILQEYCDGGDLEAFVNKACGKTTPSVEQLKERSRRRSRGCGSPTRLPGLGIDMIYSFFKDILAGLAFLHNQGLIHRDMKASNCLIDTQVDSNMPRILVSDFGEAQLINSSDERSGSTGTLAYTAPEIVRGEAWSAAADMFSLGMILYFLTHAGTLPYHALDDDYDGLRDEICHFQGYSFANGKSGLAEPEQRELQTVLTELLSPNPADRPSCSELLSRMQLHDRHTPSLSDSDGLASQTSPQEKSVLRIQKWPQNARLSAHEVAQSSEKQVTMPSLHEHPRQSPVFGQLGHYTASLDRDNARAWNDLRIILLFFIRLRATELFSESVLTRSILVCAILFASILESRLQLSYSVRFSFSIILLGGLLYLRSP